MRSTFSFLVALAVGLALVWSGFATAFAKGEAAPAMSGCHDMAAMGDSHEPAGAPVKPSAPCVLNCAVGCAVAPDIGGAAVAILIAWGPAFDPPGAGPDYPSAVLEAEDPPPRNVFA